MNSFITALRVVYLILWTADLTWSFQPLSRRTTFTRKKNNATPAPLSMCICINCAHVTDCKAYHFVETKHEQPHMNENPIFEPREGSPTIHVNIRSASDSLLNQVKEEHENETRKAEEEAETSESIDSNTPLTGKTVYDLSSATTIEYDVVACQDFVEDTGAWVRNMPDAIKKSNPNFVPS